jgi:oxygen-independent coproporphyrinogen III oxidase
MKPISVYVHIPFCTVKCGYCDFNAYSALDHLKAAYNDALLSEIASWKSLLAGRCIATVGFGGGTPGEVPAAHIAAVLDALRETAEIHPGAEVSLEANPGTTSLAQFQDLRAAGVTRLSLGAQSFDPDELRFLDRIHSPQAIAGSVSMAREATFESVGLDLIYGLPGQALDAWNRTLRSALDLQPDHISTYALTVEEGTPLGHRVARGMVTPLDPDDVAAMYDLATDSLEAAGFHQYELSNWARPGHESRHNRVYWQDGEYLGVGAGAHGYLRGERYENISHPRDYIAAFSAQPHKDYPAVLQHYQPDQKTAMFDWLTLALRLIEGFDPAVFERRFEVSLADVADQPFRECESAGLLEIAPGRVRLTRRGRLMHGEVAVRLLAHLEKS